MTFHILGHRRLGSGVFIRLDRQHLIAPDGHALRRDVVRHPGGVAVLPIQGETAYFVSQRRAPFADAVLEIPAGKREPGIDPAELARRELAEEIGAEAEGLSLLTVIYPSPGYSDEVIHIFAAHGLRFGTRAPDGAEEREAKVVTLSIDDALSRIERGELRDAKTQVALLSWAKRRTQS